MDHFRTIMTRQFEDLPYSQASVMPRTVYWHLLFWCPRESVLNFEVEKEDTFIIRVIVTCGCSHDFKLYLPNSQWPLFINDLFALETLIDMGYQERMKNIAHEEDLH